MLRRRLFWLSTGLSLALLVLFVWPRQSAVRRLFQRMSAELRLRGQKLSVELCRRWGQARCLHRENLREELDACLARFEQ